MEIKTIIGTLSEEQCKEVLANLLESYLTPAFGALPKLEVELIVLEAFVQLDAISTDPQSYELVSKLKVTRAKARKLIYERELRRLSQEDLDARVKELLTEPLVDRRGDQFILEVDNPLLSDHLRDTIQKLGYITDGSFSPSLVKLSIDAFAALVEDNLSEDPEKVRKILIDAGAPDTSIKGVLIAVCSKLAGRLASEVGEEVVDQAASFLGTLLQGKAENLLGFARTLFIKEGA